MGDAEPEAVFDRLGLKDYEAEALRTLLTVGDTTAPNLAEATGIPKARIYDVLGELVDRGFVEEIPGRPKTFQPRHPEEILDRARSEVERECEQRLRAIDETGEAFVDEYGPAYERASEDITPTEELFYVVNVGEPSEAETRRLYEGADDRVDVLTKSFEYFDRIEAVFGEALDRGVDVRTLFLHPDHLSDENAGIQRAVVDRLRSEFGGVEVRFSESILPWRGTIADPSMAYETGKAVLLVEEKDIPLHMRQAAVTENAPFVAGLERYFELIWRHESVAADEVY